MDRGLTRDANGVPIPEANGYSMVDAAARAQPVTAADGVPVPIAWPANAISLGIYPIGSPLWLCDPTDNTIQIPLQAKCWMRVPGKARDVTTVQANGAGTTFYYVFEVVK